MKYIYKSLSLMWAVIFLCAFFLSRCDSEYMKICHKSGDFCTGYLFGDFMSEISEGYKTGYAANQNKQLILEADTFAKTKTK